ncbi:helix-turn-helix transcriptional regulator [bacterium]|nr:helix-turn-helix transcriptional regulator [bacterium]
MAKEIIIQNKIRELRFFADEMTQKELAQKVGVSRQTIIAIEGDKYSPSLKLAFGIAEAFGVSITEAFSYEAVEEKKNKKK